MNDEKIKGISCLVVLGLCIIGAIGGIQCTRNAQNFVTRPFTPSEQKIKEENQTKPLPMD